MMFMPSFFFFLFSLFLGIYISLSSLNWIYVWMGLEINMVSFIPLMMCSQTMLETESSLKYFLVQAFGSGILLFGVFFYNLSLYMDFFFGGCIYLVVFSLMIKLGIFPFHYWLPHVMGGSSWFTCFMLSVVQKLAPMFVLFNLFSMYSYVLGLLSGLSSLIGGLGGLNQSQIRFILAYSSIGHMGWMGVCCMFSYKFFLVYFFVYSLINMSIMGIMSKYNMKSLDMLNFKNIGFFIFFLVGIMFMSLAGLPPFVGFYPKMMVINMCMMYSCFPVLMMLILGSLMNIFYYLNIFFNLYLNSHFSEMDFRIYNLFSVSDFFYLLLVLISSFGLGLFYFFLFYAMVLFYKS